VDALLSRGQDVRVLDDFSSGSRANLPESHPRLEVITSDLTDMATVCRAMDKVEYVFHLAAALHASHDLTMTPDQWACPLHTANVLAAAYRVRVKRLVYSSCESVYGAAVAKPLVESDPTFPLSPYAYAKLTGEQQCVAFSAMFGMDTVRLRYFNVFGPRQTSFGVLPAAILGILKAMLRGEPPTIEGTGKEPQDVIYVDDVVHANLLAAEAPRLSGKVYNIASGRPTTLNEIVTIVNGLLGTNLKAEYVAREASARGSRLADITRAEVDLGFCPSIDLEHALGSFIAYYRARPEELDRFPSGEAHSNLGAPHVLATRETRDLSSTRMTSRLHSA
jgi:UDP-glucose 4-epimerase